MLKCFYILSIYLISSCNSLHSSKNEHVVTSNNITDTLSYTYTSHRENSQYLVEQNSTIDTAFYEITYPEFKDHKINELVKPYILLDENQDITDAGKIFIQGYDEFVEESSTNSISFPWYKDVKTTINLNTHQILALSTFVDEYTGGAHSIHYQVFTNIDLLKNKKVKLDEFIESSEIANFTKVAEKIFRKNENLSDTASLKEDFFFENGIFAINDNFGLTKDRLIIFYNEYEIKPYAAGTTTIEIPYTAIKEMLSADGLAYIESINKL